MTFRCWKLLYVSLSSLNSMLDVLLGVFKFKCAVERQTSPDKKGSRGEEECVGIPNMYKMNEIPAGDNEKTDWFEVFVARGNEIVEVSV